MWVRVCLGLGRACEWAGPADAAACFELPRAVLLSQRCMPSCQSQYLTCLPACLPANHPRLAWPPATCQPTIPCLSSSSSASLAFLSASACAPGDHGGSQGVALSGPARAAALCRRGARAGLPAPPKRRPLHGLHPPPLPGNRIGVHAPRQPLQAAQEGRQPARRPQAPALGCASAALLPPLLLLVSLPLLAGRQAAGPASQAKTLSLPPATALRLPACSRHLSGSRHGIPPLPLPATAALGPQEPKVSEAACRQPEDRQPAVTCWRCPCCCLGAWEAIQPRCSLAPRCALPPPLVACGACLSTCQPALPALPAAASCWTTSGGSRSPTLG